MLVKRRKEFYLKYLNTNTDCAIMILTKAKAFDQKEEDDL